MRSNRRRRTPRVVTAAIGAAALVGLAACGGQAAAHTHFGVSRSPDAARSGHGTVKVLYAGSLTNLMEKHLGPAFEQATGDTFQGYAGGSTELANQITGKVRRGDVFVSASPKADRAAGHFVRWYATFATAPVVIGYSPKSTYAADFRSKPWYDVVTEPGITVGRTDPKLDPKGKKTVVAVDEAARKLHEPALKRALSSFPVFPEQTLVGRLQSGQLDAGFFYSIEAKAIDLPAVSVKPAAQQAVYTVTVLRGAPDERAAEDFVRYLLGHRGTATLKDAAFDIVSPPTLAGDRRAVPKSLARELGSS